MSRKKVVIIGAGPGGLAAGMRLISLGYHVSIYEKAAQIGGRTAASKLGAYCFDIGPSSLTMPHILTSLFMDAERNMYDYLTLIPLDPLYQLHFKDTRFRLYQNKQKMQQEWQKVFPCYEKYYQRFMAENAKKMLYITPLFELPVNSLSYFLRPRFWRALPSLTLGRGLIDDVARFFTEPFLRYAFTLQTRYLGMSPWQAPSYNTLFSFAENYYGTYYAAGGNHAITTAMADVFREKGGTIHLGRSVVSFKKQKKHLQSCRLQNGEEVAADYFIFNGPPPQEDLPAKTSYTNSAVVWYLGLDIQLPLSSEIILFPDDLRETMSALHDKLILPADPLIYISNPSSLDPTLAPPGHSVLRITVPVPHLKASIDWHAAFPAFEKQVMHLVRKKLALQDLSSHIRVKHVRTPLDWQASYHLPYGALFGTKQTYWQRGFHHTSTRFHRRFKNGFLVGSQAHPGSSLPYILLGAEAVAKEIHQLAKKKPTRD
ncbi:phytoene desaturase family protein [Listeria costaricensis]|uniref:phytoene desaturase family protein n=1 Tax=Listeria costaricensis TaxID=2026604 RepID=UPI0013C509F6|nr:phytoene desaturase family protein [Listeria costaricensis]